ncbi:sensor histidine kinase [Pseudalkalibacillus sp. A8]|uniref:sensor histidine kinase n=1 Tax=Pseudalkalibacillus sp. A8 TaxID=3382641 RepID=UPI0038B49CA7
MKSNKVVLKLGGTILILFLVVLLPLGYVTSQIFTNFYYGQVQEEIDGLSRKYANSIQSLNDKKILSMFGTLAELTNKEIYIIDPKAREVVNSGIKEPTFTNDEKKRLTAGEPMRKKFIGSKNGEVYLGSGQPIYQSEKHIGTFFVIESVEGINESIEKVKDLLILSGIGAFLLAIGFTFIASKRLSDPLLQMEKATRQIAKGNLDVRLNLNSNDELGSLGKAINDLAKDIDHYRTNRNEFFANISHELRTPISYINGYSTVLKKGLYNSEEEKIQYLSIIEDETQRMTRLINDLFDLSKMEEGKIDLNPSFLDLNEIFEYALLKIKIKLDKKNLILVTEVEENMPEIYADGGRVEQIITNLIENAVHYTNKGKITIKAWFERQVVKIRIKDTGSGIPNADLPYIFDRFHRVDKSRSRKLGGSGLGLAIVKQLVEIQNGTITVKSEEGKGTLFELSFPISDNKEAP